jgi:hypothetical protein
MRIVFRLAEILEHYRDCGRGLIKRICDHTRLERHQVKALLSNKVRYLSLESLAAVCEYLIKRHQVDPATLPGILFGIESGDFVSLLTQRVYVEINQGMRSDPTLPERRWVTASDSFLYGSLLRELFGLGRHRPQNAPQFFEQRLVSSFPVQADADDVKQLKHEALWEYNRFHDVARDRALICLGSVKSNILCEMVMAQTFRAEAFQSQDHAERPTERRCPVYLRYRDNDAHPPSCYGGLQLARRSRSTTPGMLYEKADGTWQLIPCTDAEDAALVMYAYRPPLGTLEMVMGGFSGKATQAMGSKLHSLATELWPPQYDRPDLKLGVFLIHFHFGGRKQPQPEHDDPLSVPSHYEVIPLQREVLERRFA